MACMASEIETHRLDLDETQQKYTAYCKLSSHLLEILNGAGSHDVTDMGITFSGNGGQSSLRIGDEEFPFLVDKERSERSSVHECYLEKDDGVFQSVGRVRKRMTFTTNMRQSDHERIKNKRTKAEFKPKDKQTTLLDVAPQVVASRSVKKRKVTGGTLARGGTGAGAGGRANAAARSLRTVTRTAVPTATALDSATVPPVPLSVLPSQSMAKKQQAGGGGGGGRLMPKRPAPRTSLTSRQSTTTTAGTSIRKAAPGSNSEPPRTASTTVPVTSTAQVASSSTGAGRQRLIQTLAVRTLNMREVVKVLGKTSVELKGLLSSVARFTSRGYTLKDDMYGLVHADWPTYSEAERSAVLQKMKEKGVVPTPTPAHCLEITEPTTINNGGSSSPAEAVAIRSAANSSTTSSTSSSASSSSTSASASTSTSTKKRASALLPTPAKRRKNPSTSTMDVCTDTPTRGNPASTNHQNESYSSELGSSSSASVVPQRLQQRNRNLKASKADVFNPPDLNQQFADLPTVVVDPVTSRDQYESYRREYNSSYDQYIALHREIEKTRNDFKLLGQEWLKANDATKTKLACKIQAKAKQRADDLEQTRREYRELHGRLKAIKQCVTEYVDQQNRLAEHQRRNNDDEQQHQKRTTTYPTRSNRRSSSSSVLTT
eukprot:TRINITY_DN510_c0_g3_i1.p1 TRINITY_DN510_c0_g3~~TRINITY_DN510_c0_g3_i1.p1  ORF type:complete len:659 (-),score=153.45 TRINITY_DN510_c0_g3_i1:67-2043(-)